MFPGKICAFTILMLLQSSFQISGTASVVAAISTE